MNPLQSAILRKPLKTNAPAQKTAGLDVYDYGSASLAGVDVGPTAGSRGHLPSDFKGPNHPDLVVGGFNTKTRERVPGTKRLHGQQLVERGWSKSTARYLDSIPE